MAEQLAAPEDPSIGAPLEIIRDPSDAERPVGRLRVIAAAITLACAIAIVALTRAAPPSVVLLALVLVAASFWWRRFRAVEQAHAGGRGRTLTLGARGLSHVGPDGAFTRSWAEVTAIAIDHDRMCVEIRRDGGLDVIEPPLGGLGLEALARRVEAARAAAARPAETSSDDAPSDDALSNDEGGAHNSTPEQGR